MSFFPWYALKYTKYKSQNAALSLLISEQLKSDFSNTQPTETIPTVIMDNAEHVIGTVNVASKARIRSIYETHTYPLEPDDEYLTWHVKPNGLELKLRDWAYRREIDNGAYLEGEPKLCIWRDDGNLGGDFASLINYDDTRLDYFYIPDHAINRISSKTEFAFCYIFCPKYNNINLHNGLITTMLQKRDDTGNVDYYNFRINQSNQPIINVRKSSVLESVIGPAFSIIPGAVNILTASYDHSGSAGSKITAYLNGVALTDTGNDTPTMPGAGDDLNVKIGIGNNNDSGKFIGAIYDVRFYSRKFTTQEHLNFWNNNKSITQIEYGNVSTTTSRFADTLPTDAYDDTAFDTTGFG